MGRRRYDGTMGYKATVVRLLGALTGIAAGPINERSEMAGHLRLFVGSDHSLLTYPGTKSCP